jgi:hypothetical protein
MKPMTWSGTFGQKATPATIQNFPMFHETTRMKWSEMSGLKTTLATTQTFPLPHEMSTVEDVAASAFRVVGLYRSLAETIV